MIAFKISNNKGFRFKFFKNDKFLKNAWCIPLKNKNAQIITNEFSKTLTSSNRGPLKKRAIEVRNSMVLFFKTFCKGKNRPHYSRFTDKEPSITERVNLLS